MSPSRAERWYRWQGNTLIVNVHVQPKAKGTELAGEHGQALKVRVAAPPADGQANKALCKFMAQLCGVAPSNVQIRAGANSRAKRLAIEAPKRLPPGVTAPPRTG